MRFLVISMLLCLLTHGVKAQDQTLQAIRRLEMKISFMERKIQELEEVLEDHSIQPEIPTPTVTASSQDATPDGRPSYRASSSTNSISLDKNLMTDEWFLWDFENAQSNVTIVSTNLGTDTDDYLVLVRDNDMLDDGNGPPVLTYAIIKDVFAAVDKDATPDYVGATSTNGFLRTDIWLEYNDNGDSVQVVHSNGPISSITAGDGYALTGLTLDYGHVIDYTEENFVRVGDGEGGAGTNSVYLPAGNYENDMLRWDGSEWVILDAPTADYQHLQRQGGALVWDYPRCH